MIIKISALNKSFKEKQVLHDISLKINKGDIFGLVGPDGAGKTTFIRTILGLYLPDNGEIQLFGSSDIEQAKSNLGYVPQEFSLNTDMTVWENIALFAELQNIKDFSARAEKLLKMVWLLDFKDRLAGNLSGGMKQKLALICGIIHNPELLVLDEPTTGVDPVSRREFWQMLYRLNKEGLTILISTPYMDEVELCTKIAFLHLGKVRALGSPTELLNKYPYLLYCIKGENIRAKIDKLYGLPAHTLYLKGDYLIAAFTNEEEKEAFMPKLEQTGLENFSVEQIPPSLEDLFGSLSESEQQT